MPTTVTNAIKEAAKYAAIALVVLGAVPAIAQAAGLVHIVVPSALLGYATLATGAVAGFLKWAKDHGYASRVAAHFHR